MEWVRDITESRRADKALREERERLRFIIDGAGLGTWEWDVRSNRTVFNDTWAAMLGYTLAELSPYDYQTWVRLVHPDDIGRAESALDDCIAGRAPQYECEMRMRRKDGRWIWILYTKMLSAREDVREVSVPEFLSDIADSVVELFPATVSISLEKRFEVLSLDAKKLFPLGIILNELLTNAMKYAFEGRPAGRIEASLEHRDGRVLFAFRDDGIGLPPGFDPAASRGFGITLVRILSEQPGGTARFESESGTRVTVEFPV